MRARSATTRHRSGQSRNAVHCGYAAAEWLASTSRFQIRLRYPLGITPAPAPQPISVRALTNLASPSLIWSGVMSRSSLEDAVANRVSTQLGSDLVPGEAIADAWKEALET